MSMKKMQTGSASVGIAMILLSAGCGIEASGKSGPGGPSVSEQKSADLPPAAPVRPDEVIEPREGSKFDAADYVASEGPFRLFGIELGDGTNGRRATIADATTWATRSYAEGDLVGRGMKVAKIEDTKVILRGATSDLVLEAGSNVQLRVVRHKLDVVAKPLGKHHYALDTAAARAARPTLPTFETAELYGGSVLKLGPVEPGSLLAEAGLVQGDLVTVPAGGAADESALQEIQRSLTDGRPEAVIRVVRGGIPIERIYTTTKQQ